VTIQAWGSAAVLVAASVLIGDAISLLGARCRAAGPAVGLSVLIVISLATIQLPGRATTTVAVLAAVLIAAAAIVITRRGFFIGRGGTRRRSSRPGILGAVSVAVTIGVAAFGAAIPYIANGTVGLPGVSLDNDTTSHLWWAEGLRSPSVAKRYGGLPAGYPLGPHSLADAISSGLGVRLDMAFTGLLIATVIITALVAAAALRRDSPWKRPLVGALAALFYLVAAYYGEGAFKETLIGLLLLALVLHLDEVRGEWIATKRALWPLLIPASLLVAGALYVYSYPALVWIGLTVMIWLVAEVVARPGWLRRWRILVREIAPGAAIAGAIVVLLALPVAGQIVNFAGSIGVSPAATGAITVSNTGNIPHPLPGWEGLGIWNSPDFRFPPFHVFYADVLPVFALGVLVFGMVWAVRRREFLLPAAVAACAIVFWRSGQGQSAYVTAKALVIAGPVVAVTGLRGLLGAPVEPLPRLASIARYVAAAAFIVFAANSSYHALRNEPVWPPESTRELLALDRFTRGQTVLFLGNSDYAPWLFADSNMSALAGNTLSLSAASSRSTKPNTYGTALDWDSVDPATINRFTWVVTSNTTYASQAPTAFRLVRQLPMYQLWRRVGYVQSRGALDPAGAPGAVLDCKIPTDRRLSLQRGVAALMTPPVTADLMTIRPGGFETATLRLAPGRWEISLQYVSPVPLQVAAGDLFREMPSYLDRPGPYFAVGSVVVSGRAPTAVIVHARRPSPLTGPDLVAQLSSVAATRSPDERALVPLRRACGRYVDWFRIQPS
jgi:hypothetical protein